MNAAKTDVSKRKCTVAVIQLFSVAIAKPFDVLHKVVTEYP